MKRTIIASIILLLLLALAASIGVFLLFHDLPRLDTVEDYHPPQTTRIYDSSDNLIAEFFTEKRTVVSINTLPKHVINAFLAAEDADFYHHQGIDYWGLLRAILNEARFYVMGGQRVGGSTITQQTAKTMLLSRQRTYTRKLREVILAHRIEQKLTKDEILNLYINQIYFGSGAYGIEEAAQTYYGKHARELTLGEASSLASVPKSPNRINPINDPIRVRSRRDYVLEQMLNKHFISTGQYRAAKLEPIVATPPKKPFLDIAPHFVEVVRQQLTSIVGPDKLYDGGLQVYTPLRAPLQAAAQRAFTKGIRELDKRQGWRGALIKMAPPEQAILKKNLAMFKVWFDKKPLNSNTIWDLSRLTSADFERTPEELGNIIRRVQLAPGALVAAYIHAVNDAGKMVSVDLGTRLAQMPFASMKWAQKARPSQVVKAGDIVLVRIVKVGPTVEVALDQIPKADGALVAIQPQTHGVVSMVGGYDFRTSNFNRATQARRQSGSAIKPFIYGLAIDTEKATPATLINDEQKIYNADSAHEWKPRNWTGKFLGEITVRTCLRKSVNMCSISLLEMIGIPAVHQLAKDVGLFTDKTPFPYDLTVALGSADVVPLDLVNAYAIFPDGGKYAPPVFVDRVMDASGTMLWQAPAVIEKQVIRPQSAFVMTNMMKDVVARGTASLARRLPYALAGKTGTTNDMRSVWFVGFSPDLLAGVYIGFDDNRSLGINEYPVRSALPIWIDFMQEALPYFPSRDFVEPEGVVWRIIDEKTGTVSQDYAAPAPATSDAAGTVSQAPADDNEGLGDAAPRTILEAFIEGTEPTDHSHTPVPPLPSELFDLAPTH